MITGSGLLKSRYSRVSASHPIYSLPNWWVANCELSRDDPHYNSDDYLSLPYQHVYFMDVMSFFDLMSSSDDDNEMANRIEPILMWMRDTLKGQWRTCSYTRTEEDTKDVRIQMWFSFDLDEDAMLTRMTWPALRRRKHVNS